MTERASVLFHGLFFFALCVFSSGCALLGGVRVEPVATSVEKPSNVALYVAVRDWREPVPGLAVGNFSVSENGQPIPADQSQITLLDRDIAAVHHTLVLVDMSTAMDDESKHTLARAVAGFVARTRTKQGVTVYVFDGSPELTLAGEFPRSAAGEGLEEVSPISAYALKDPSRNLYGAVAEGLKQLDARLMQAQKPVRVGTLVVFTQGPDSAGRLNDRELRRLVDKTPHHVIAIGIGHVPRDYYLDDIGRAGVIHAQDRHTLGIAFEDAAKRVGTLYDMYYLVSYCSPARAGQRTLRLEVAFTNKKGEEKSGSAQQRFDATGFGPGCDSRAAPHFVLTPTPEEAFGSHAAESSTHAGPAPSEPKSEPKTQPAPASSAPESDSDAIVPPPAKPGYAPPSR